LLISGDGSVVTSMHDARNDARNEGGAYQRVEVITGRQRRRRWTAEEKAGIVAESLEVDANISDVARRHGVARGLLTIWRRQLSSGGGRHEPAQSFAAVKIDTVAAPSDGAARHSAESDAVGTALPAIRSRGRIEIDVAGARIRIESGVDHATLAMVLAAVRGDK
jgi:transposase